MQDRQKARTASVSWPGAGIRKQSELLSRLQTAAIEAIAHGILITDSTGTIVWANPGFTNLTGYSSDEVIGQTPRILQSGHQDSAFYRHMWETILSGHAWHNEIVNQRKDGSLYTEEMTIFPITDDHGQLTHFIAIKQDLSQFGQVEATPDAAPIALKAIIDGVADPIMVIGMDYRVKLMNRAAGGDRSEDAGTCELAYCYQVSHHRQLPCSGREHPCPLQQVRKSCRPVTVVHEHYQASGEPRFVEVIATPLWGEDGTLQGIIESMRDITERRRVEESLRQHAERLRCLSVQLAGVEEAERHRLAQELHDQVGQNLTALGINLNIIRSQLPEATAAALQSRLDDSLSLVVQTAERIRNVMAELRPPVLHDYGIGTALRWYGEQFTRRTNIDLAVQGEETIPRLASHIEIALFRIVQEALTNVAKHAQATTVTVTVQVDDRALRLVVADNGIGFVPESLPAQQGGRGWGLFTMAERAEAVGGHIRVESAPGQGTRVCVEMIR